MEGGLTWTLKKEVSDSNAFEIEPTHNTNINLVIFFESLTPLTPCSMVGRTAEPAWVGLDLLHCN